MGINMAREYIDKMNSELGKFLFNLFKACLFKPKTASFIIKTLLKQKKSGKIRAEWEKQGIHIPPYLIASLTQTCNLRCKGCYSHAKRINNENEMTESQWKQLFYEARELGIFVIMLAGGEPLMRKDILSLCGQLPEIVFPVFTNGLLLDKNLMSMISKTRNIIPVISIEGLLPETDDRRGKGVYGKVMEVLSELDKEDVFYGLSITVTSENFETVTGETFLKTMSQSGCKLFFLVEYVPVQEGTENLIISDSQKQRLLGMTDELRRKFKGVFVNFPGDESTFGGCLAAGRGFIHVSPDGKVEPCPFAPYSDTRLGDITLKEALKSELLEKIRDNHSSLVESNGGCALWTNREWVKSLVPDKASDKNINI